ncbi:SACOL1771 family peroxiredoxin [Shouchella sp. JSM 1781072]|uniref:SACOL1771 family peroxiredoxin n=1 Tax=Bacillaceae TaxID=186817 RepID=UPI000C069A32|nr:MULTISPECIES: SACOL1771 family peroxiredoxin [Bacillaceae]UTR04631.1 SACOL1771 family peroxiredoxin [Alkalihalobacillus sp. LMS6]
MLHQFFLECTWNGGRNSTGEIKTGALQSTISIPKEMNGPGEGTNPDEMLLGAAATCFVITYAAMLERAHIEKASLTLSSEAKVDVSKQVFTFKEIIHRPVLTIINEHDRAQALKLAYAAEQSCMISKALHGNVTITVEPSINEQKM